MRRIYAAVYGSGLGHVARVHSIAKSLKSQSEFLYSSFDEGYDYLKTQNEKVIYAPPLSIKWNMTGGVSGKDTLIGFPRALLDFSRQVEFEDRAISDYAPNVVISDSRLSAVFAAKRKSLKVVTILNQIRILFPPRFRGTSASKNLERIEADILGLMWSLSDKILFPDLPPPYTIAESNISHVDSSRKLSFTGFMIPRQITDSTCLAKVKSLLGLDSRPLVFIQISGPNVSKKSFADPALECARELGSKYNVVLSLGFPNGSREPKRILNGSWIYEWCPVKDELFSLSDLLVARSGHTTIGQCIDSGKPSVLVPIYNHSEQICNAEKSAKLGIGIEIRNELLDSKKLQNAIESCIEEPKYRAASERLQKISRDLPGTQIASQIIRSLL